MDPTPSLARRLWRILYWRSQPLRTGVRWAALSIVPPTAVRRSTDLSRDITVCISTYLVRYNTFFYPLLNHLRNLLPEVQIIVAANGFPDRERQDSYLTRLRHDWTGTENLTFITHRSPKGLAQLWNEMITLAPTTHVLILNDDIRIVSHFRSWLDSKPWECSLFCLINHSWSHFVLDKRCLDVAGSFDERFTGIGFEDIDYEARMRLANIHMSFLDCIYLRHVSNMPNETSFDLVGPRVWGKYTNANLVHFLNKWELTDDEAESVMYVKQFQKYLHKPSLISLAALNSGNVRRQIETDDLQFIEGVD